MGVTGDGNNVHCCKEQYCIGTWNVRSMNQGKFSSVAQSCPTLRDPMNRSTPGLPVHHQLLESTQARIHQVGDAIQPSHPLSSPSLLAPNPSPKIGSGQTGNGKSELQYFRNQPTKMDWNE